MQRRYGVLPLLLSGILATVAEAHPVSYKEALSFMTWNQPYLNDIWSTYSFRPNAAVALRYMRMDMKDGSEMKVYVPQADFLLYRKNHPHYQANLYVFGGYGGETMDTESGGTG